MGDIKIFDIDQCVRKFNLTGFIETGTLYGDTVDFMKDRFEEIHSIEINKDLAEQCNNRFRNFKHINIHNGNSYEILPKILTNINRNILFWLDAHFPGADAGITSYNNETDINKRLPLENELKIISQRDKKYKDVIIIDDLWLYEDGPFEWGDFDSHAKLCKMNVTRKELMGEISSDFVYKLFQDTHNIKKVYKNQGYFIIYPKE